MNIHGSLFVHGLFFAHEPRSIMDWVTRREKDSHSQATPGMGARCDSQRLLK